MTKQIIVLGDGETFDRVEHSRIVTITDQGLEQLQAGTPLKWLQDEITDPGREIAQKTDESAECK